MKKILNLIIVFLIATEGLFVGQYVIVGIAGYRWVELFIFFLLLKQFLLDVKTNKFLVFYTKFLVILIFLLAIKVGYLTFFDDYVDLSALKHMIRIPFFLIIPYLAYYVAIKDIKYLKIILSIQILIFSVAFFQFPLTPLTDLAWQIKDQYFYYNTPSDISDIGENILRGRVPSLYGYAIPFSYALTAGGILSAYLYKKTENIIYILAIVFILVLAVMSLTRSVMLALLLLFFYLSFSSRRKKSLLSNSIKYIIFFGIVYIGLDFLIQNIEMFGRVSNLKEESASGRMPLLITGVYALMVNPFGVSPGNYQLIKEEMYAVFHDPQILEHASHNGLLTFGFYYTFIGMFVFIYILYLVKKIYLFQFTKQMRIFFIIAFFSYVVQAFFHNNFIFVKDFSILIIVTLFMYEYRITKRRKV